MVGACISPVHCPAPIAWNRSWHIVDPQQIFNEMYSVEVPCQVFEEYLIS